MEDNKSVVAVDDATFETEVLQADRPVLVDFGAVWCKPCNALAPIVAALAIETLGTYKIASVDISDAPAIARRYGIRSIPTLIVFRGGEKVASHVGVASKDELRQLLEG